MAIPLATHKRANAVTAGVFLIGLGIISYLGHWWPGILLVIGTSLFAKQILRGKYYDLFLTALIFGGLFAYFQWGENKINLLPVLFVIGGIYLIFREFLENQEPMGIEKLEDKKHEIEETEDEE